MAILNENRKGQLEGKSKKAMVYGLAMVTPLAHCIRNRNTLK